MPAASRQKSRSPGARKTVLAGEDPIVTVTIEGRPVAVRAWRYELEGVTGHRIPIYFLDTDLEQNDPRDRTLTDTLYGGDADYRLRQEAILGIGGARMLRALEYEPTVYHMNEGHAALLTVPVLEQELHGAGLQTATERDVEAVRRRCVFTTHTPVPAGHDRFSGEQAYRILGAERAGMLERFGCFHDGLLNVTYVALRFSRFVNGVAMQHGKVSRQMFPDYTIDAITNGVHAGTWTAPAVQAIFDKHLPRWRQDNVTLRYAIDIPENEIVEAHAASKQAAAGRGARAYRGGTAAGHLYDRICAAGGDVQARRSAVHGSGAAAADRRATGRDADFVRGQGASGG